MFRAGLNLTYLARCAAEECRLPTVRAIEDLINAALRFIRRLVLKEGLQQKPIPSEDRQVRHCWMDFYSDAAITFFVCNLVTSIKRHEGYAS
jgi:hypothetical protein